MVKVQQHASVLHQYYNRLKQLWLNSPVKRPSFIIIPLVLQRIVFLNTVKQSEWV